MCVPTSAQAHIITAIDAQAQSRFLEEGYVAVGAQNNCKVNWDIIADLARVREGDWAYLHTRGEDSIVGPYVFRSRFLQRDDTGSLFHTSQLCPRTWDGQKLADSRFSRSDADEFWRASIESIPTVTHTRRISSKSLFMERAKGLVHSIPPRFWYGDMPKVVKPLLYHEIGVIQGLFAGVSAQDCQAGRETQANSLPGYVSLDFSAAFSGQRFIYEKTLESWLMAHCQTDSDEGRALSGLLGVHTHFANSIYTIYTDFMDVIMYDPPEGGPSFCSECQRLRRGGRDYQVIELKRDQAGADAVSQVEGYISWAREILAGGQAVIGHVIAKGFNSSAVEAARASAFDVRLHTYSLDTNGQGRAVRFSTVQGA